MVNTRLALARRARIASSPTGAALYRGLPSLGRPYAGAAAIKRDLGQPVGDVVSRGTVHILPSLGDLVVAE
jgi:hypothetical protein